MEEAFAFMDAVKDHPYEDCGEPLVSLRKAAQDAGVEVFGRMKEADAIVYATPLYCWGFTAQVKPLIDRHLCLATGYGDPSTHKSHIESKRVALLVTAAGQEGKGNSDLITEVFKRLGATALKRTCENWLNDLARKASEEFKAALTGAM